MTPVQASEKKNEAKAYRNLYAFDEEIKTPRYAIGDLVRITKKKNIFEKRYTPRWTMSFFLPFGELYIRTL